MVVVDLLAASICFLGECHPVLVGSGTPVGEFQIEHVSTSAPGYGGDVLLFKETPEAVYAIHRVWLHDPAQRRLERLTTGSTARRIAVTQGCINVMPEVFERLVECCSDDQLRVTGSP